MPALMNREATVVVRQADPAELLFDTIMAEPCARRIDRIPGAEGAPADFQQVEALIPHFVYQTYFIGWD